MYQPYPSSDQPAVRTAVKLMYAGAAIWTVLLISGLVLIISGNKAGHAMVNGHALTAAQASQQRPLLITVAIVSGLVAIALWLWMAQATGQGKNWARILSTVLFGLATLEFLSALEVIGKNGVAQAFFAGLTWLSGLGAVWLLWRPASSAFFKSAKAARSRPPAQISGP
jgi:hypothetical protein